MTSPNYPKMVPSGGTSYLTVFGTFRSIITSKVVGQLPAVKVANGSRIIFLYVRNINLMSESNFMALESIERYSNRLKRQKFATTFRPKMTCNSYKWEMTNIDILGWRSWLDNKKKKSKTNLGSSWQSFFCKVALKKQNMLRFGYYVHCNVRR